MKVTIVIPVFNGASYIKGALDSCIYQTYSNIEILIVNDGSTDSTLSIIQDYESKDSRIRHISQNNSGLVRARKTGVENTSTDYFLFLDADDILEPNAIECLVDQCVKTNADVIFSNFFIELENGKVYASSNNKFTRISDATQVLNDIFLKNVAPTIWGKLIKTDLFLKIDTPDIITIGEDAVAIVQILLLKPKISYIDQNIYHYIQRKNSMVNTSDKSKNYKRLYLINYLKEYITSKLKESDEIIVSLKSFLIVEIFDILRDGGIFSDVAETYRWCMSSKSLLGYKNVLGFSRIIMLYSFRLSDSIGAMYRNIYNTLRRIKYGI